MVETVTGTGCRRQDRGNVPQQFALWPLLGKRPAWKPALSWEPSSDPTVLGYNVYRSSSYTSTFTRLNATLIIATNYTDHAAPTGGMVYLARPVALTSSTTGSYTNIGQGAFLEISDTTIQDSDSDGCPDFLEVLFGMNAASAADATNDIDNDGSSSIAEYRAGTDPTNRASAFQILRFQALPGSNVMAWYGTTNSGVTNGFVIQRKTNMLGGPWAAVDSNLVRSASGTNVWCETNAPGGSTVFYRIAIP